MPWTRPGCARSPPGSWPSGDGGEQRDPHADDRVPRSRCCPCRARATSGSRSTPPAAPSARGPRRRSSERAAVLLRVHDLVLDRQAELLDLVQLESGKARAARVRGGRRLRDRRAALRPPRSLAAARRPGTSGCSRCSRVPWSTTGPRASSASSRPWNYPLSLAVTDAIPALLAGNAVVLRPDLQGSLTALAAAEIFEDAGLPEDLLQVVLGHGEPTGQAVVDRTDYVSFTGSTATGRRVAQAAGRRLVGISLELGGKNTMYVAADADVRRAAAGAVRACFSSAGQLCISAERLVVHADVYDEFVSRFVELRRADAPVDRAALGRRHGQPGQRGPEGEGARPHRRRGRQGSPGAHRRSGPPRHRAARRRADRARGGDLGDGVPRRGDLRAARLGVPRWPPTTRPCAWPTTPSTGSTPRCWTRDVRRGRAARRPHPRRERSTSTRAMPPPGAASPPRWAG